MGQEFPLLQTVLKYRVCQTSTVLTSFTSLFLYPVLVPVGVRISGEVDLCKNICTEPEPLLS